jgi:hypothetical protein
MHSGELGGDLKGFLQVGFLVLAREMKSGNGENIQTEIKKPVLKFITCVGDSILYIVLYSW